MATQTRPEGKARSFGENIESDLASRFLRVVEVAAIASARTMGQGERKLSDQVATEAMRQTMDSIPMRGTIVIGEGGPRSRHRRRSAGRHKPLRHWRARGYHSARRLRARRPASRSRLLHGENRRRTFLQERRRTRRARGRQLEKHREADGARCRRPGRDRPRPPTP